MRFLPDSKGYSKHFEHEIGDEKNVDNVEDLPVFAMNNGEENDDDIHEDKEYRAHPKRDMLDEHSHVKPKDAEK